MATSYDLVVSMGVKGSEAARILHIGVKVVCAFVGMCGFTAGTHEVGVFPRASTGPATRQVVSITLSYVVSECVNQYFPFRYAGASHIEICVRQRYASKDEASKAGE